MSKLAYDITDDGMLCEGCNTRFKVMWMIPDKIWLSIVNNKKALLCGMCITQRIESLDKPKCFLTKLSKPSGWWTYVQEWRYKS